MADDIENTPILAAEVEVDDHPGNLPPNDPSAACLCIYP